MLNICLLGCGGGMPMPFRNLSSTLFEYKGRKILLDCGEGTQVSIRMISWGFKSIDLIIISHTHGDHIVGLPGLLSTIGNSGRVDDLTIIGPKGIKEVVENLLIIAKYLPYKINILENEEEINLKLNKEKGLEVNDKEWDLKINSIECDHSSPCLGYNFYIKRDRKFNVEKAIKNNVPKLLWNKLQKENSVEFEGKIYNPDMVLGDNRREIKVSFITDSRPVENMAEFIKESDLFICEGTYGDDKDIEKAIKNKHMTFRESSNLAKRGNVKKLLLTHFSPAMINPKEYLDNIEFPNYIIGEDRLKLSIKFEEENN